MATATLVESDLTAGKRACEVLRADKLLRISAALWWFEADRDEWRYLITTPLYDEKGGQAAYLRVGKLLRDAGLGEIIPVWRVWATETTEPVVKALRRGLRGVTLPKLITDSRVGGEFVDGAYIYYLPRSGGKRAK